MIFNTELLTSAQYSHRIIFEKGLKLEDNIYYSYDTIHNSYQILEEMKNTYYSSIKFFQDTSNTAQLGLAYKEFEYFMGVYNKFIWFYHFDINKVSLNVIELLNNEEK